MGRSELDLTANAIKIMDKLLLISLLGTAVMVIIGAEEASQEQSLVGELSQLRDVRSAHPGTAPGKKKNGGNLKESSKKKKAGKKRKNSRKGIKKGKENQKRRNKNKGKSPKKKKKRKMGKKKNKGKGKKTSRKNKGKAAKKTK